MSGYAGWFHREGKPAPLSLSEQFQRTLSHRGPDQAGSFRQSSTLLTQTKLLLNGHRELCKWPASSAEGLVLAGDLRLDRPEGFEAVLGSPCSEEQAVIAAYRRWGLHCAEKLQGDFSFAIWDPKLRGILLARDRFGVKPLLYHLSRQVLVFGSEVAAILEAREVDSSLNHGRICDYLVEELEVLDLTSTFFEAIQRLPPAHCLWVGTGSEQVRRWRYWRLQVPSARPQSAAENLDQFRELLTRTVARRVEGVASPSVMLSGGLDSSSLAALLAGVLGAGSRPQTYSIVDPGSPSCRETASIQNILRRLPLQPNCVPIGPSPVASLALRRVSDFPHDLFDTRMDLQAVAYAHAQARGTRVMLDGVDGDIVASLGLGYLACLAGLGRLRLLLQEARAWGRHYPRECSARGLLWWQGKRPFVPSWVSSKRRSWSRKARLARTLETSIIAPDFAREIRLGDRLEELDRQAAFCPATSEELHVRMLESPHLPAALERYDRMASRFSIEPRHPFVDQPLIEFCVGLPWNQKVSSGWGKLVLRRALAGQVPDEVLWRLDHSHLGRSFFPYWVRETNWEADCPGQPALLRPYVDLARIDAVAARFQASPSGRDPEAGSLWEAASVARLLRLTR